MRALLLISLASLALSACGGGKSAQDSAAPEQSAADQSSTTNDVTAIDAATGEAANMAADVNYILGNSVTDNSAATPKSRRSQPVAASNSADNEVSSNAI